MRWVGIDEAGYGPNLGPLVMTAVVAEGPDGRPRARPLGDLADHRRPRRGGGRYRLWVDDSKRVYQAGKGRDRLDATTLAIALAATGRADPDDARRAARSPRRGDARRGRAVPLARLRARPEVSGRSGRGRWPSWTLARRPFEGGELADRRRPGSVVVGPRDGSTTGPRGDRLQGPGPLRQLRPLLAHLRGDPPEGQGVAIRGDKHGGRHFYADLLAAAFPDARVVRGAEGPDLSRYEVFDPPGRPGSPSTWSPGPTPRMAWSRWPRSSARPSASTGWTPSTPTGWRGCPAFGRRPATRSTPPGSAGRSSPRCPGEGPGPRRLVAGER